MSLFKKDYFDIGRTGSPRKFMRAYNAASKPRHRGTARRPALLLGAERAFGQGHPENVQAFMKRAPVGATPKLIYSLIASHDLSDKRASVIDTALATASKEKREEILTQALTTFIIWQGAYGRADIIATLLDSGAPATTRALVLAIAYASPSVVEEIYKHGASFDEALKFMRNDDYYKNKMEKVQDHQQEIEAEIKKKASSRTGQFTKSASNKLKLDALKKRMAGKPAPAKSHNYSGHS